MSQKLTKILNAYHIYVTKPRLRILESFLKSEASLDLNYFLHQHPYKFDRSTVFRTLKLFVEKKIVYAVPVNGNQRYFFQHNKRQKSKDFHSSLVCSSCGKVIPVDMDGIPKLKLPQGFVQRDMELIIHGNCGTCKL